MRDLTLPRGWRVALLLPALAVFLAFWLLPMAALVQVSGDGHAFETYRAILTNARYLDSLWQTVVLSALVTLATLALSLVAGLFLTRHNFAGKSILVSMLTLPLAFPGVVVGFMVIMLAGRQGLIGDLTSKLVGHKLVFAYSLAGLFLATDIDVLPMTIYTEFTLNANVATAAALSVILGIVTWAVLMLARNFAGQTVAAGG
jgi:putative spermidine/putrescine transport system permease protein